MKRVFLRILYAVTLAVLLLSCVEEAQESVPVELIAPSISVETSLSGDSFTVEWTSVPNAVSYSYSLNGATEVSTAELSVTFSDMEPGSYNVRVKAVAQAGGEYMDSQWSSYDFDLVSNSGADSGPERLAMPELMAGNITEDSFSVSWSAVEGAGGYACSLNGGEEMTTSGTEIEFTGLEAGDYIVKVKAVPADASKYVESEWASLTVTVGDPDDSEELDITGYYRTSSGTAYQYMIEQTGATSYYIHTPFTSEPFTAERDGNRLLVNGGPVPTYFEDPYGLVDVYMFAYHPDYSNPENEDSYVWPDETPIWEFDAGGVTFVNGMFIGFEQGENSWAYWDGAALLPGAYAEKYDPETASAAALSAPGPQMLAGAVAR